MDFKGTLLRPWNGLAGRRCCHLAACSVQFDFHPDKTLLLFFQNRHILCISPNKYCVVIHF